MESASYHPKKASIVVSTATCMICQLVCQAWIECITQKCMQISYVVHMYNVVEWWAIFKQLENLTGQVNHEARWLNSKEHRRDNQGQGTPACVQGKLTQPLPTCEMTLNAILDFKNGVFAYFLRDTCMRMDRAETGLGW